MFPTHNVRPSRDWQAPPVHCSGCGAKVRPDPDLAGVAQCSSCLGLYGIEVLGLPTTVLSRFETAGVVASRTGPSDSGMCSYWLDRRDGTVCAGMPVLVSRQADLAYVPCGRARHVDDRHEWDEGAVTFTLSDPDKPFVRRGPRTTDPRWRHVEPAEFRKLRDRAGLSRPEALARLASHGIGSTPTNLWQLESRSGGSIGLYERVKTAYEEEE